MKEAGTSKIVPVSFLNYRSKQYGNELMSLPMVALRGLAVLPEQVTHFDVSREKSVQAITQAMKKDQKYFL